MDGHRRMLLMPSKSELSQLSFEEMPSTLISQEPVTPSSYLESILIVLSLNLYKALILYNNFKKLQALDNRMLYFINNSAAIIALLIQSFVFSWQITLAGTALIVIMTLSIYYCGRLAQIRNTRTSGSQEIANVIFYV